MRRKTATVLGMLAVLAVAHAASANLITNGGFETCVGGPPGSPSGWTVSDPSVVRCVTATTTILANPPAIAPFGTYMAELKGERDQNLQQTFLGGGVLDIRFSYNLLAWDFPNGGDDAADWFRVLLDGSQIFSASINAPVSQFANTGWQSVSYTTGPLVPGSHTLEFCIDTTPDANPVGLSVVCGGGNTGALNPVLLAYVDNVEVVPEPASLLLLGTGLFGLAQTARRLRRR